MDTHTICPKCQQPIQANSRFCGSCGQMIEHPAAAPRPIETRTAALPAMAMAGGGSAAAAGLTASSSAPGLIERIKNIVLSPKSEWPVIAPEPTSIAQLYAGYVSPLAALAALMAFVHMSVIGVSVPFAGSIRTPMAAGLTYAALAFGFGLIGVFLVALIINALAPHFAGERNQRQALKVAAYSLTPAWLSSILALSPVLPTLLQLIAGLYGIYVLYLGLPVVMRSARERAFAYTATVVICTILLGILLGLLSAAAGRFGLMPSTMGSELSGQAAARDQGAAIVGNVIGNALGTDEKGKAGLTAALSNLVKAGQQSEQQPSAGAQDNASASGASGDNSQNPVSAATGLLSALGGAMGGSHPAEVVDYKSLTPMLPVSLPGMKRTDARGETQGAIGVKTASATAEYQGANGTGVHIEISDLSAVSGLMNLAGALVQTTTSESDSGYEKDKVIGGRTVHEKYDAKSRKAELSVVLAKRFQVEITGDGVDMSVLEQALGQIDLARLEAMKDQGAKPQ